MGRLASSCMLLLLASAALPAAPDPGREAHLLAALEDVHAPADSPRAPGAAEEDLHLAVREAHRLLDEGSLSPEAYARFHELLALPADVERLDSPGAPGAPAQDGARELRTEHFRIAYYMSGEHAAGPDGNGNGTPDKVEWAAEAFELAWRREIKEMGYPPPPDLPAYRVVLHRLRVNALTHPAGGGHTWCEFNFGMREGSPDDQIKSKFRAVACHEFFHAIQAVLNWDEEEWWTEGSADWMSELADPGNGFFVSNASLRLERPEIGLASQEPFFPYAGSLFAGFLTSAGKPDRDLVKDVWLECGRLRRAGSAAGSARKSFVRDAITAKVGPFEDTVARFWPHVYLRNYPEAAKLPRAARLRLKDYPAVVKPDSLPRPDPLGANFVEFHPAAGREGATLHLSLAPGEAKGRYLARVLALGKDEWKSIPMQGTPGSELTLDVAGFGTTWRAVTVVVVNAGRAKAPYSLAGSLRAAP